MSARIEGIVERLHGLHPRLIDLEPRAARDAAGEARPSRAAAAAGDPRRRHQRQGQHLRLPARHRRGGRDAGPRLYLAASGPLQRAHPHRGHRSSPTTRSPTRSRHVERVNAGAPITVFEVITAVALHLFAQHARRIMRAGSRARRAAATRPTSSPRPAACAITSISLDHRELLGDTLAAIAAEKAGILKPGVPARIGAQPRPKRPGAAAHAAAVGAPVSLRGARLGRDAESGRRSASRDASGALDLPPPSLAGRAPDRQCGHRHRRAARVGLRRRRTRRFATGVRRGRVAGPAATALTGRSRRCCRRLGAVARRRPQSRRGRWRSASTSRAGPTGRCTLSSA